MANIKAGKEILDALDQEDKENVIAFVFNIILEDVKMGLKGENAEIFFEIIAAEFQKPHSGCYFSQKIDGNAVDFNDNTEFCPICAVKVRNILRAYGVIGTKEKKAKLSKLLH